MINPAPNYVLLRIEPTQPLVGGMTVFDFVNEARWGNVFATVVAVADQYTYLGRKIQRLEARRRSEEDFSLIQRLRAASMLFDVPMEVKAGDQVMVKYEVHIQQQEADPIAFRGWIDAKAGLLVVPYSDLVARIDDGWFYPLNANVFTEVRQGQQKIGMLTESGRQTAFRSYGRVVAVGARCRHYMDFWDSDSDINLIGRDVSIEGGSVRIEFDPAAKMKFGDHALYMAKRREIVAIDG